MKKVAVLVLAAVLVFVSVQISAFAKSTQEQEVDPRTFWQGSTQINIPLKDFFDSVFSSIGKKDEPVQILKGDADADGELTVSDARTVLRAAIGLCKPENKLDADSDGKVTVNDARIVLRSAIGVCDGTVNFSFETINCGGGFYYEHIKQYSLNQEKLEDGRNSHSPVFLVNTRKELDSFMDMLTELTLVVSDEERNRVAEHYRSAFEKYDESFFEKQSLLLVFVVSGSSGLSHSVTSVEKCGSGGKSLCVYFAQNYAPPGTATTAIIAYRLLAATVVEKDIFGCSQFDAIQLPPLES